MTHTFPPQFKPGFRLAELFLQRRVRAPFGVEEFEEKMFSPENRIKSRVTVATCRPLAGANRRQDRLPVGVTSYGGATSIAAFAVPLDMTI
jgi:hypothetical protein